MPIRYKPVNVSDNIHRSAASRYMARSVGSMPISLREIAQNISQSSSFSTADVIGMVERLLHDIPNYLAKGFSVHLGEFGIFTTSLRSESRDHPGQVNRHCIKEVKVNFKPGTQFKLALEDIDFVLVKPSGKSSKNDPELHNDKELPAQES